MMITCGFCGSRNDDGDHRCRKCGRTPNDTLTGEVALHRTQGQLAMKLEMRPAETRPKPANPGRPYQPSLFQPASNLIPFEAYAPVEPRQRQRAESVTPNKTARPPRRRVPEEQGTLDFLAPAPPKPRTLGTTVQAVIFCDAPVAVTLHRAVAAALDWSMVLIAYGIFLLTFHLMGGSIVLDNKPNVMVFGGVLADLRLCIWPDLGGRRDGIPGDAMDPPESRRRSRALRPISGSASSGCSARRSASAR